MSSLVSAPFGSWLKAAGIRAIKTFAQTALAVLALGSPTTGVLDVGWLGIGSVAALAAIVSLLTSVVGLPELEPPTPVTRANTPLR